MIWTLIIIFIKALVNLGLFKSIIPDENDSFDLDAYKNVIKKPRNIKMFPTIQDTIGNLFQIIYNSGASNDILQTTDADYQELLNSAQEFVNSYSNTFCNTSIKLVYK